ncbi:DUF748 domain-containing protein [Marinomonas transparens]|uniref:DUF748 domain-containing protein n=1 Tax=Marinomonas transparens TaxID=2795388 RepID=A0A934JNT3_9GAMM|nr:DUF748 domain-containing protein [Marinomonas transparens]MBJ7537374.1 DUF748 domain-containing protein [Marinomonas transparens]
MTRQHFRHFVFLPFVVIAGLITLIWLITPFVAKHYLSAYIEEQGQELSIDHLSINFFPPKMELEEVAIHNQNQDTLTLKHAVFEVSIFPLFTRTVTISKASIDGLNIVVDQRQNDWIIAGINTAQFLSEEPQIEKQETTSEEVVESSEPWHIKLPSFSFTNSHFHLSRQADNDSPIESDTVTIQNFSIKDLSGSELNWQGKIALAALLNEATVGIKSQFSYSPQTTKADVEIDKTSLPLSSFAHFLPAPYNQGNGTLGLKLSFQFLQEQVGDVPSYQLNNLDLNTQVENLDLMLNEQDHVATALTKLDIQQSSLQFVSAEQMSASANIHLESKQTQFTQGETQASIGNTQLSIDILEVVAENDLGPKITGTNVTFSSQALDSQLAKNKRIAAWTEAGFNGVNFSAQGDNFNAQLAELTISDLTLSELLNSQPALAPLAHIGTIKIANLEADQDGALIKSIITDSMTASLFLDANKNIKNLIFVDAEAQTAPTSFESAAPPQAADAENAMQNTQNAEQNPAFKAPYHVILDNYEMTGESSLYMEDNSISPALKRTLNIDTLSLHNLNTKDKDQAATFALKARNGKYSTIQNDVKIWPMADKLTMQSEFIIKEAELPPYSSYIADALGYQIDSGQLNLDLTLEADNGKLNGNSHLLLREFDLGGSKESSSAIKAGAMPLNIAVGILKDSDNNIDLNIPLTGDVENPEFGWQNFLMVPIRNALFQASSSYLMQTFVPYANVISVAKFAGEQLLKIRVEPLLFIAEDAHLNTSQDNFLEQLSALMKDKEESKLKACGVSSFLDLGIDQPPSDDLDPASKEAAKKLAVQRSEHLKDYLIAQGIDSSRIFLCAPEVDLAKNSKPRIELNF